MAGVQLREKKVRTAPTNTSLLPPCKVCLDQAKGFHYGVNTCEACKGFFRRSLIREKPYECLGNGNCIIRARKRPMCPKCRYLKCLAVGMSIEAIKTGRYTHAKRTQDTWEYLEMMGKFSNNSLFSSSMSAPTTSSMQHSADSYTFSSPEVSDCSQMSGVLDLTSVNEGIAQISTDSTAFLKDGPFELAMQVSSTTVRSKMMEVSGGIHKISFASSVFPSSAVCSSSTSGELTPQFSSSSLLEKSRSWSAIPIPHPAEKSMWSFSDSPQSPEKSRSPSAYSSSVSTDSGSVSDLPQYLQNPPSSSMSSLSPPTNFSSSASEGEGESCPSPAETREEDLSDEECARIVQHLLQIHDKAGMMPVNQLSDQELLRNQFACYERCRIKFEMLSCNALSAEEYLDIYTRTGLEIDNRQELVEKHLVPMMDQAIRRCIIFCKSIPGFAELSMKDKLSLIKNNRFEFRMLCSFKFYNTELKVMTLESGCSVCVHDISRIVGSVHGEDRFECARVIKELGLFHEELVLLKALVITTVGAEDLDDPARVNAIQWQIAQCLLWLLKQNHPNANIAFARIITKMWYIRGLSASFFKWLSSDPVKLYRALKENKLMTEWFSCNV